MYSEIPDETENFGNGKVRALHNLIYRFKNLEVGKPKSETVEASRKISMKHFRIDILIKILSNARTVYLSKRNVYKYTGIQVDKYTSIQVIKCIHTSVQYMKCMVLAVRCTLLIAGGSVRRLVCSVATF